MSLGDSDDPSRYPPPSSGFSVATWIAVVALLAVGMSLLFRTPVREQPPRPAMIGQRPPAIRVEGWLNGPGPSAEELSGKLVVLDMWAYWCGPCRAAAPEMIEFHDRYKDRGVVFIGLTAEGTDALKASRDFVAFTKVTWPQGYGAEHMLSTLEVHYLPQNFIIGRDGLIAWDESSTEPFEKALERLANEK